MEGPDYGCCFFFGGFVLTGFLLGLLGGWTGLYCMSMTIYEI